MAPKKKGKQPADIEAGPSNSRDVPSDDASEGDDREEQYQEVNDMPSSTLPTPIDALSVSNSHQNESNHMVQSMINMMMQIQSQQREMQSQMQSQQREMQTQQLELQQQIIRLSSPLVSSTAENTRIHDVAIPTDRTNGSSSARSNDEALYRELDSFRRAKKDKWSPKAPTLTFTNYSTWKSAILSDALLIDAADILNLAQREAPASSTRIKRALWAAKNDALHARIWTSIGSNQQAILSPLTTTLSAELWEQIAARFGLTKAQDRYNLLRDMCALKLDGLDYFTYQSKWMKFRADARNLNITLDDVIHDLFIQNLGDKWQSGFIRTKIDEFVATGGGNSPIKNLNLDDFMRQLQFRAQSSPLKKNSDQSNAQESQKSTSDNPTTNGARSGGRTPCSYCKKSPHPLAQCYFKNPEKAPSDWLKTNLDRVNTIRKSNGDSNASLPTSGTAKIATIDESTSTEWYFDTCASHHMTPHRNAFTSYTELASPTQAIYSAFGQVQRPIAVGTIELQIDGSIVQIHDVQHIPALDSNLISVAQLSQQDFKIELDTEPPFDYVITSPEGSIIS